MSNGICEEFSKGFAGKFWDNPCTDFQKKGSRFFYSRGNTYWNFSFPKISKNLNWLPSSIIQTGKLFKHISGTFSGKGSEWGTEHVS